MQYQAKGALASEWALFSESLGLTSEIIPIVSDTAVPISPASDISDLGKTPSYINGNGEVVGLRGWPRLKTTPEQIAQWKADPRLGLGINTRAIHALDIDVDNEALSGQIAASIEAFFGFKPPRRVRSNSPRFLVPIRCESGKRKASVPVEGGRIELLRSNNQFVAAGEHPSGVRYQWDFESEFDFPTLSPEKMDELWDKLINVFAIAPPSSEEDRKKPEGQIDAADPVADFLRKHPSFISQTSDKIHMVCPFKDTHTNKNLGSSTSYLIRTCSDPESGRFRCLHDHCSGRSNAEFMQALGIENRAGDVFEPIGEVDSQEDVFWKRYIPKKLPEFLIDKPVQWLIDDFLPRGEIGAIYGESGAGKSFVAIDIAMAIARGVDWNGRKTTQGKVVYIAAEGASGMRSRVKAYLMKHGLDEGAIAALPFEIIDAAPNLRSKDDTLALCKAVRGCGKIDLLIIDTLAQVTPGANENGSEDMSIVISHCRGIHTATGATVELVHHSGKDTGRGLRGWSGLKGALDVSIEVTRQGDARTVYLDKLKDGEDGIAWTFKLKSFDIGNDMNGKKRTSCVVEYDAAMTSGAGRHGEGAGKPKTYDNRSKWKNAVMRALNNELTFADADAQPRVPIDDLVRKAAIDFSGTQEPIKPCLVKARRVVLALEKIGALMISDGFVYPG